MVRYAWLFPIAFMIGACSSSPPKNPVEQGASPNQIVLASDSDKLHDIEVANGETLIIAAGSTLRFLPGAGIICRGRIEARGTEQKPILFTSMSDAETWGNISLIGEGCKGSRFTWCRFLHGAGRNAKLSASLAFEGFSAENSEGALNVGGAVFAHNISDVEFSHCAFAFNRAFWGGPVACWFDTSLMFEHCLFTTNEGGEDAGALHCVERSNPTIRMCCFEANSSKYGGAIHCLRNSAPIIKDCYLAKNIASGAGGAFSCYNHGSPFIDGCLVRENSVSNKVDGEGSGLAAVAFSTPSIYQCCFTANSDKNGIGAGLYAHGKRVNGLPDTSSCNEQEPIAEDVLQARLTGLGVLELRKMLDK